MNAMYGWRARTLEIFLVRFTIYLSQGLYSPSGRGQCIICFASLGAESFETVNSDSTHVLLYRHAKTYQDRNHSSSS